MNNTTSEENVDLTIEKLKPIVTSLINFKSFKEKLNFVSEKIEVQEFIDKHPFVNKVLDVLNEEERYIIQSLIFLNQGELLLISLTENKRCEMYLKQLLDKLKPVEHFYAPLGGIIGYHLEMLKLIHENKHHHGYNQLKKEVYLKPPFIDISQTNIEVKEAIKIGLECMPYLVEIYPVGGAGDRLMLKDELTQEDLPAAELKFEGYTLLEGLIRDLQAKEYLYYKVFGEQIQTPIVLMTSDEKNNHHYILKTCEKNHWFGRKKENFFFVKQPLVPVLSEKGTWALSDKYHFMMKPGGHGVIWKLLLDACILDHFIQMGKLKALVRQINNPLAGIDYSLLCFTGIGFKGDKKFGFTSCPRLLNTAEGMDVLIEKQENDEFSYCITNIEYTDFLKKGIHDLPEKEGSSFSAFPANTNILFVDLQAVKKAAQDCPVPGKLINMKSIVSCISKNKIEENLNTGRLESLMQNIADLMVDRFKTKKNSFRFDDLQTYLTYNDRKKTISVTKKMYHQGDSIVETPLGAYYDKLLNYYELLELCKMKVPQVASVDTYLKEGPSFIFKHHPALGPTYDIIIQKIRGGSLHKNSLLILEIADLYMDQVEIEGALAIIAENVCGHKYNNQLQFSDQTGKCVLKNVKVKNHFNYTHDQKNFWKDDIHLNSSLKIILQGHSMFTAENVTFDGNFEITVPNNEHWTASEKHGEIVFKKQTIKDDFSWAYTIDSHMDVKLAMIPPVQHQAGRV